MELQAKGVISLSPRFNTRGTAICVGDKMDFEIERTHHCADDAGYAVAIDLCKNKISYRIISEHFPKEDTGRGHNFLDYLTDWLYFMAKTNKVLILGGDINCVENTDVDSLHRKNKNSANKILLIEFGQKLELVDPFRELYPTKRSSLIVVHRIPGNPIGLVVMVDWIGFIFKKMSLQFVKDVIIQPCVLSDHDYVILSFIISSDSPNRGPGYWKLNVSILDKLEAQNEIEFLWHQELKNINVPDSDWCESCKTKFKEKLILLSRKYKREHNLEKAQLKEEILQYRKIQMASFKPELFESIITE